MMRAIVNRIAAVLWPAWQTPRDSDLLDDFEREARVEMKVRLLRDHPPSAILRHRDEIAWWQAPIPWPWHCCLTQTIGYGLRFGFVYRCACGAIRGEPPYDTWIERNTRSHPNPLPTYPEYTK